MYDENLSQEVIDELAHSITNNLEIEKTFIERKQKYRENRLLSSWKHENVKMICEDCKKEMRKQTMYDTNYKVLFFECMYCGRNKKYKVLQR